MPKNWNYNENKNKIIIDPPKQTLRITGHRMSSVLGLNEYQTPFGAWCEITKLVKLPFEDTKYTIAGKAIEPKLIDYMKKKLPNVVSIEDYYGNVFEDFRWNNFKDDSKIYGGVIDAVTTLNDKKTLTAIIECKTSSHPEHWSNGMVPTEYLLQGALYSYLKGLKQIIFVCTFLNDIDYAHPENFEANDSNTIIVIKKLNDLIFEVNGEYLNIEGCIEYGNNWWKTYIESGISPEFDETKDKEYLDIIRSSDVTKDTPLLKACEEAFELSRAIKQAKVDNSIDEMEKRLKSLENSIKQEMIDSDTVMCGNYKLNKQVKKSFREEDFAKEHEDLYNKYIDVVESYRLTKGKGE